MAVAAVPILQFRHEQIVSLGLTETNQLVIGVGVASGIQLIGPQRKLLRALEVCAKGGENGQDHTK